MSPGEVKGQPAFVDLVGWPLDYEKAQSLAKHAGSCVSPANECITQTSAFLTRSTEPSERLHRFFHANRVETNSSITLEIILAFDVIKYISHIKNLLCSFYWVMVENAWLINLLTK